MRIVAELPHPQFKITIFSWNAKYIIKIELSNYEQVFKVKEEDVTGLDDVLKMVDEAFLHDAFQRFLEMRNSFSRSFQKI